MSAGNNAPAISVIIPVYNVEQYLRDCLDSLTAQTFTDIEIICVNDGSKDKSGAILESYALRDSRFVILNQRNQGAGAARNRGLDMARGTYTIMLDADDFFKPDMLEKTFRKAESTGADMTVCRMYLYRGTDDPLEDLTWICRKDRIPPHEPFSKADIPETIFQIINHGPFTKLYRSDFIKRHGLRFENLKSSNDVTFSLSSVYNAERIAVIHEPLVYYRVNIPTSITSRRYKTAKCIVQAYTTFRDRYAPAPQYLDSFYKAAVEDFFFGYQNCGKWYLHRFCRKLMDFLPEEYQKAFESKRARLQQPDDACADGDR